MTSEQTVTVEWDPVTDAACAAILDAVAEAKDVDPIEIGVPLYDVVDPDAIDRLFENTGPRGDRPGSQLTFRYEGCEITVESEGTVTARPDVTAPKGRDEAASAIGAGVAPK